MVKTVVFLKRPHPLFVMQQFQQTTFNSLIRFCLIVSLALSSPFLWAQPEAYHQALAMGESAIQNRQYAQAIQHFYQATKLAPSNPEPYLQQMKAAIYKRDLSTFKRSLQQLDGLEYDLPVDAYLTYAQLARKQRLYKDGLAMLEKATLKYGQQKSILLEKTAIHQKLNQRLEAIQSLKQAIALDPKDDALTYELALIYMDVNSRRSMELFQSLQSNPAYQDAALTSLGLLHTKLYQADPGKQNLNNLVLARGYYEAYAKKHPKDQEVKEVLGYLDVLLAAQ